jgi:hypothetical protein
MPVDPEAVACGFSRRPSRDHELRTGTRKGRETYRPSITIPDNAAIGRAHYEVSIEYTCNLVQRFGWPVKLTSPPIYFEITAEDE